MKKDNKSFKNKVVFSLVTVLAILSGCRGNTAGGGSGGTTTAPNTGSVDVEVVEDRLAVGSTTGFRAFVFDKDKKGVENIQVTCDSEAEIAIIEPTSGRETTDSGGAISGVIGCRKPGSYLFGCRAPVGANKRKFVTVICQGDVPAGFEGFPGAGGGGLGGGAVDPDNGGRGGGDSDNVRVTKIVGETLSSGTSSATQFDTQQQRCDNKTPAVLTDDFAEPFGDDFISLTVVNNTSSLIQFDRLVYVVDNGKSDGRDARSPSLAVSAEVAAGGGTVTIRSLFLKATASQKSFGDNSTLVPISLGFRNTTFTLYGTNADGEEVSVTASTAFSYDTYNNCSASS